MFKKLIIKQFRSWTDSIARKIVTMPSFLGRIFNKKKKENPSLTTGQIAKQLTEEEVFGDFSKIER